MKQNLKQFPMQENIWRTIKMEKKEVEELIKPHIFKYKGKDAIAMESGRLDFKATFIYLGVTPSGNVRLGKIYQEGQDGVKYIGKTAKVRIIGDKKTLALGSGKGTDNYYLDLE